MNRSRKKNHQIDYIHVFSPILPYATIYVTVWEKTVANFGLPDEKVTGDGELNIKKQKETYRLQLSHLT